MTDTQILLEKITALRKRLAETQHSNSGQSSDSRVITTHHVQHKVAAGRRQADLLDTSLRPFQDAGDSGGGTSMPPRLISRSSRLLTRGHHLLHALRSLTDDPLLPQNDDDPLGELFQESVHMIDVVLRTIQVFPPAPSAQIRLCAGLEATLEIVSERLGIVTSALEHRKYVQHQVQTLAEYLQAVYQGALKSYDAFDPLIEELLDEADQGRPLLFLSTDTAPADVHVARHALTVARVMARVAGGSVEWRHRRRELVLAALFHDIGMLAIPHEILTQEGPLNDSQRREVERHTFIGRDVIGRLRPIRRWLMETVAAHHERNDGTGYPMGFTTEEIPPLTSLLTVCDLYAALCCDRPYRTAVDPRTALTDILVLADQGALARPQAEHLFHLSFYPIGSLVELDDGSVGIVIDTHSPDDNVRTPARPILLMMFDNQGLPAPIPFRLDLAQCPERNILRRLSSAVRREVVGKHFPELV